MKKTKMLKKNYEFSNVLSKGKYYSGKTIEAFILENNDSFNHLGLAVNRKYGHAYQRNKVKRLIKESFRKYEDYINKSISIVFLWKKNTNIKDAEFYQINEDILQIFRKAKIIDLNNKEN